MPRFTSGESTIYYDTRKKNAWMLGDDIEKLQELLISNLGDSIPRDLTSVVFLGDGKTNVVALLKGQSLKDFVAGTIGKKSDDSVPSLKTDIITATEKPPTVAAGIVIYCAPTNRFLVCIRGKNQPAPGKVACFGGKLEPGETPEQGAIREVREESGIQFTPQALHELGIQRYPGLIYHNFIGMITKEIEPKLNNENEKAFWVKLEDLDNYDVLPELYDLLTTNPKIRRLVDSDKTPPIDYEQIRKILEE